MQALILAAGQGRRLGSNIPKPLIEIGGQPLLIRLISQLQKLDIRDIGVVLGYQRETIRKTVENMDIRFVYNEIYDASDNMYSFWIAREELHEDCIISHTDLILEDDLLRRIVQVEGDVILPMDTRTLDQESMKIRLADDRIARIGKEIPLDEADGESIPCIKFSAAGLEALKQQVETIIGTGDHRQFLESAIQRLIGNRSLDIAVLDITGSRWAEIDTPADLESARKLFKTSRP